MTRYRPQRGSLADSMKACVEVQTLDDLIAILGREFPDLSSGITRETVKVTPYGRDPRNGWATHLVTIRGLVAGYTDGPLT